MIQAEVERPILLCRTTIETDAEILPAGKDV
jgi:hypothetical protein